MRRSYFNGNFFEDLFCNNGRFGCTNRFAMPKKKSEKEEKKRPSIIAAVKSLPAAAQETPAAGAKETKARKSPAPRKKAIKAPTISGDDIALRAYFIAERRQKMGWPGDSTGDWVEAERQLRAEAARKK
jgi:hypothetical protein